MMAEAVKCPHCGTRNDPAADRCRLCGKPMSHEHVREPGSNVCAHCGQPLEEGAEICNACTRPVRDVVLSNLPTQVGDTECVHWSEKPAAPGRSARVAVAGILLLIAGALGIGQAVVAISPSLSESLVDAVEAVVPGSGAVGDLVADYVLLQAWSFIAGLLAIAGGMFALTATRYELALMGGLCGFLAIGFLMGAFFGLLGLLILVFSKKEFLPEC